MKAWSLFRSCSLAIGLPLFVLAQAPVQSERALEAAASSPPAKSAAKVDLNTADIPALEAIPEIGTDLANGVVAARPFKSVDEAARVLKLSPQKMASLRERVFVSPPKPATATPTGQQTTGPSTPPTTKDGLATPAREVTERYDRAQAKKASDK